MQVKIIYEPINPAELFQSADVLVVPIFITTDVYASIYFDAEHRRQVIFDYLKSRSVSFIALPENVAILFLACKRKHNKKRILKNALRLYMSSVSEDYGDYDVRLPGLRNVFVTPANSEPMSEYLQVPSSRNPLIIHTGDDKLDRVYRSKVRTGEFSKFTPDNLAHPTIRASFEKILHVIGMDHGFDVCIVNVVRHRRKAFVTCDIMELEAS